MPNQIQLKSREDLESAGYVFGGPAKCRGCGAAIFWFETPKEKRMPFSWLPASPSDLEPHWATCPQAKEFKKKK